MEVSTDAGSERFRVLDCLGTDVALNSITIFAPLGLPNYMTYSNSLLYAKSKVCTCTISLSFRPAAPPTKFAVDVFGREEGNSVR